MIKSEKLKNKIIESTHQPPYENLLLMDLPGEVWKPFPVEPFDEYYVVSSKGRVKRLGHTIHRVDGRAVFLSEMIMKQVRRCYFNTHLKEKTYGSVCKVSFEGKRRGFPTARLIYHAFVEPFDLYGTDWYVRHKDGNGLNCQPDNLYLLERRKLSRWLQDRGRRPLRPGASDRSKYTKEEVERWDDVSRKTVSQYDLEGHLVQLFKSRTEAAKAVGITSSSIRAVIRGKIHTAGGFIWREGKESPSCINVPTIRRPVRIAQYSPEGELIHVFSSIKEAADNLKISTNVVADRSYGRSSQRDFILKIVDFGQEPAGKIKEKLAGTKVYQSLKYKIPEGRDYPFQNLSTDDLPGEVWKEIPHTEQVYYASNLGRIKSVDRIMKTIQSSYLKKGQIIYQSIKLDRKTSLPILVVHLRIKKETRGFQVPNLIYRIFHGEVSPRYTVRYIDNDSLNCRPENLVLKSIADVFKQYYKEGRIDAGPLLKPIAQYTPEGKLMANYSNMKEAAKKTGISIKRILESTNGKTDKSNGFVWKFIQRNNESSQKINPE